MKLPMHLVHLVILVLILLGGVASFLYVAGNQPLQFLVGVITAIAYVAWGIIHHMVRGDLHKKVVVEYSLIGIIAIILLFIVLGS